ncbi:MAG: TlpA disulfide reductase family protein [Desulfosalsimonadaceae bacterium]
MKKLIIYAVLMLLFFSPATAVSGSKKAPPKSGDAFPAITLPTPQAPEYRSYLGLSGDEDSFAVQNIKTQILIIEIFSMYCPHCQREAPEVNALYEKTKKHEELTDRIKIIGLGVGNSSLEVDVFRKKYDIVFPLFPDPEFKIYERVGAVRTPYFFALTINDKGPARVIYSELGGINGAENFLEKILHLSSTAAEE